MLRGSDEADQQQDQQRRHCDKADNGQAFVAENGAGGNANGKDQNGYKAGKAGQQRGDGGAEAVHQHADQAHT